MLKGVIFDHDGTLVDSEGGHYLLWAELLKGYGVDFPEADYKRHLAGIPTHYNAEYLVERYNLPITPDELFGLRERATGQTLEQEAAPAIAGAMALADWVRECGLKMAIATGASRAEVQPTLEQYRLHAHFPVIATREDVTHAKPAPDVYRHAVEQLGLSPAECLAIEDSPTGVTSARACGLDCLVVLNDYMREHDFSEATAVVESMDEARQWIEARYAPRPA